MHVTRIEIFGFKSFMDRLVLPLEGGVTGVIGPNGCGKSNVVDALRWVLGETRARSLRGGVLEDVIFNGTDKLRPLGLAEVNLTLRAAGDNFFADLVSPELEAELVAEKVIKEAEELSKAAEAIEEEQTEDNLEESEKEEGQAEQIEDEKSLEGDEAQVKELHLKVIPGRLNQEDKGDENKESSEPDAPADNTDTEGQDPEEAEEEEESQESFNQAGPSATLLNRFSWLKAASEVQVTRRLYRSGESEYFINRVPCRLRDLKEFFRAVGVSARAYTLVAQGEVSRIVTSKPEERRMILEEAAGVLGFRDKIAAATRRLDDTSTNISRLEDIIKEITRQVNSLRRQASKARNRQSIKDRIAELEQKLFADLFATYKGQQSVIEEELKELSSLEQSVESKLHSSQASENEARSELMSIDVEGDDLRSRIDAIREELNNRSRQRSERNTRIKELSAFSLARSTEIKRLGERKSTLIERRANSQQELERLSQEEERLNVAISELSVQDEDELRIAAEHLAKLRDELRELEREHRKVREVLSRSEGERDAIKKQLVAASPINQLKETLSGESSKAFFNSIANTDIFVDALNVPGDLVTAVQSVLAEKAGFLVADKPFEVAKRFVHELLEGSNEELASLGLGIFAAGGETEHNLETDVPFPALQSLIGVNDRSRQAATRIFKGVYLADTIDAAAEYFENGGAKPDVTLVTRAGDILTDHSFYSLRHEGGFLHLKSRKEELEQRCDELSIEQENLEQGRKALQADIEEAEARHKMALDESRQRQAQVRELSKEQGNVRGRLHAERRSLEQLSNDESRLERQVVEAQEQIAAYDTERADLEAELNALVPEEESKLHEELRGLNQEYQKLDGVRGAGREKLSEFAKLVEQVRRELDDLRANASQKALENQKARLELDHLKERVLEEYSEELWASFATLAREEVLLEDEVRQEMRQEVAKLKARIVREGEVDPTSIERFEEEKQRLDDLSTQKVDLKQAADTLKRTIDRLRDTSEKRFVSTFEKVSANFAKLAPRLFGGGRAALELLDPKNPLDSGIAIIARPPGKRLKSIDLLSGGEKALCAISLIFSMFMVRPSPLCVLDEVDAPLDEANLVRYLSLIKEMSAKTQFLMITHNKASMAAADRLVGVTMQEPGASTVLSVSLQEAYDQVA